MRSNSFWPGMAASTSLITVLPVTIMFSAGSSPMRRGRRCVPLAPGRMPMRTSGSETMVPRCTTR
ncbi:Uncharacterised protein [Xylophilus ampelinus]|nr:Uncharacterised protein [Xylophilus ampelinus]